MRGVQRSCKNEAWSHRFEVVLTSPTTIAASVGPKGIHPAKGGHLDVWEKRWPRWIFSNWITSLAFPEGRVIHCKTLMAELGSKSLIAAVELAEAESKRRLSSHHDRRPE